MKDPFRAEEASRQLPEESRITVTHVGGELEEGMAEEAERRMDDNPRYEWIGEQTREETLKILSRSRALVHSSVMEGGAHAISEAIACGTPVIASDIPGNTGLLGPEYPGVFPVRSTEDLAKVLRRAETDEAFYESLREGVRKRRHIVRPKHERDQLRTLLEDVLTDP